MKTTIDQDLKAIARCISYLAVTKAAKSATVFITATRTVVVTRMFKQAARNTRDEFRVTIGNPNYTNAKLIAKAKRTGSVFELARVQLKFWPKPKAKKT